MGAIKDIVDLTTQLSQKVNDRKIAAELLKIQTLTLQLQSEQASLHEANIKLREERLTLKEEVVSLKLELQEAKSSVGHVIDGTPTCPNAGNKPATQIFQNIHEHSNRLQSLYCSMIAR